MRWDIFGFAGGAFLTALAVLNGNATLVWNAVLWAGVAGMVVSAVHGGAVTYYRWGPDAKAKPPVLLLAGASLIIMGLIVTAFWPPPPQTLPPPSKAPEQPTPAPGPSPAPPSPPPQSKPWVTDQEIAYQRVLGRSLLIYSPEQLFELSAKGNDLKIFEGKWIKVDYPVARIPISQTLDKKEYYVELIEIGTTVSFSGVAFRRLLAYFDPKKFGDQLLALEKGRRLKAICQFKGIERSRASADGPEQDVLLGYNCDLSD